jgi:flavin reductase (DIM6/NTAB) family NADH-FMN oxidoreductase RutF
MNPVEAAQFRDAISATASGVTVVTTEGAAAGRAGITVSTMCSLSLEPPSILFCAYRENRALAAIIENGVFVANVLHAGQSRFADIFAGRIEALREDRFAEGDWAPMLTGAPALAGALCAFDCKVAQVFDFGSHRIVAGVVVALERGTEQPLVHSDRAYRRLHPAPHA